MSHALDLTFTASLRSHNKQIYFFSNLRSEKTSSGGMRGFAAAVVVCVMR